MSRDINPFGLRMPPELRARLEAAAKASGRSMNAELLHRLETSLTDNRDPKARRASAWSAELQSQLRFVADAMLYEALALKSDRNKAESNRMKEIVERWGDIPALGPERAQGRKRQ